MSHYKIHGAVTKGFQVVKEEFERNFIKGIEENAQLCVYHEGKRVVDLWGSMDNNAGYDGDSLTTIFSSTKVLSAICMATLVERKLLDYSDKVVKHWPEYAKDGNEEKQEMTVANILQHEGGMALFSQTMMLADIQTENIKKNSLGRIIEEEALCYPPEKAHTRREYHAYTRGTILNEIFRRVDPQHRTMGECLRQDISTPLGADAFIGLLYEELSKSFNFKTLSIGEITLQSMLPDSVRKTEPDTLDLLKFATFAFPYMKAKPMLEHLTSRYDVEDILNKFCYTVVKTGEIPSANGQCSARGIANIAAMMANKGEFDGIQILSEETWNAVHANGKECTMYPTGDMTCFTQGGMNVFKPVDKAVALTKHNNECRNGFVGWMGLGGSVFQWHPQYHIGFGYVPTFLAYEDPANTKGAFLQKKVVECVEILMNDKIVEVE